MKPIRMTAIILLCLAMPTRAASNIDTTNKMAWSENAGWMNWRDGGAPAGTQGVQVGATVLSGFIWAENVGWINVGDGTPANNIGYANANGSDFGLNIGSDGSVTGMAWGENVGWISFNAGALATPPQPVRLLCAGRLIGFAWSENAGWINLSSAEAGKHVEVSAAATPWPCDMNLDGTPNGRDVQAFVTVLLTGNGTWQHVCAGDNEPSPDGSLDVGDIPAFVGCLLN